MLKQYRPIVIPLIVLTLMVFSVSGCGLNPEKPNPQENSDKTPEVPESLAEMEETILEAMYAIDSIRGIEEALVEIEELKEEITEESEVDQEHQEKEESAKDMLDVNMMIMENAIIIPVLQEEDVEGEGLVDPMEPPRDVGEVWYKIQQNLYDIHRQWNVLERHLQDVKIPKTETEKFEELLEEVSDHVDNEEVEESLFSLNELLGGLAEFRNHFESNIPYEIFKLRYITRKSVLLANRGDYEEALKETENFKEILNGTRKEILEKDADNELQKLELALDDLQHEISTENFHLTQIKAAIVMKNIELVQTPFEAGTE